MDTQKNLLMVVGEWLHERRQRQLVRAEKKTTTRRLSRWLPSPGSVVFTLCMIGLLLWAQTAGALPLPGYLNAPDAPSTGTIAYQGRLADASGNPLTSTVNMEFRLYNAATGGTPLWSELWTGSNAVQVSDGLFNVMLGSLDPIPQNIMTGNSSLWLGITAGTDDEMMPRVQLGSVPFAVQALTVPDESVTTAKLANGAVTRDKLDPTLDLVPAGAIIMWGGAIGTIPTGWQLCDGSNGTPDLRDRFVVGAGSSYVVGATGGANQVTLTINQIPAHTHSYSDKYTTGERNSGTHAWDATYDKDPRYASDNKTSGSAGGGQAHENRPPYYALAYICKG